MHREELEGGKTGWGLKEIRDVTRRRCGWVTRGGFDRDCAFKSQIYDGSKSKGVINERRVAVVVSSHTFVVLTLLPVLQLHPVRSGRTLHSSPSIHGCI